MLLREFRVNKLISLKLRNGKTEIYIDDKLFLLCKKLIIHLNASNIEEFNDMTSIDEILENIDLLDDNTSDFIPPELEFWGHCSNLQAWVENDYDPSLLHSNLTLPLLKKLTELGDSLARNILKEEILKRIESGNSNVIISLWQSGYMPYFTSDELSFIYENFVLPLKPSKLLLRFLRTLSIQKFLPAREYYRNLVKELSLSGSYKERRKILGKHTDAFKKDELIDCFKFYSSVHVEDSDEEERFRILDILAIELEFNGEEFDNASIVNNLVRRNEQDSLLYIINHSKYPYIRLDFEKDEVRRRAWQEKLYYDLFKGHVISIELFYEVYEDFLGNLKRLENFTNLESMALIFSRYSDYEYVKNGLELFHVNKLKVYVFDDKFPFLRQVNVSCSDGIPLKK